MITVMFLLNWTESGVKNIKESPHRWEEAKGLLKDMGGQVEGFYLISGDYDMVLIAKMPAEAIAKYALSIASKGAVRTKTLRAWNEAEYQEIIASL